MSVRKFAMVAMVAAIGVGAPVGQGIGWAQTSAVPAASATAAMASSLSAADKEKLLQKLKDAKQHDKDARKGWSQEPLTQATYDSKIKDINRLITKLSQGEDFPLSDVDKAVAAPGSTPY